MGASIAAGGRRDSGSAHLSIEGNVARLVARLNGGGVVRAPAGAAQDADAHVRLGDEELADARPRPAHADEVLHRRHLDMPAGHLDDFLDWWLVLRALDRRAAAPHARRGRRSPTATASRSTSTRAFRPDDDPAEMSHFLAEAGFLHIAGVFTEDEMARCRAEMDRAAPTYARRRRAELVGDDRPTATRRLVRMQGFDEHSPATARAARRRALPPPRRDLPATATCTPGSRTTASRRW